MLNPNEQVTPQAFLEAFIMAFCNEFAVPDTNGNPPPGAFVALGNIARDNAYTRGFNAGREQGYQLGLAQVAHAKAKTQEVLSKMQNS